MSTKFYLCSGSRILLGPVSYDRAAIAHALSHHGGSIDDLPIDEPAGAVDVIHLRLLPERDVTEQPDHPEFYHIGQPVLTVNADHVERNCPVSLYPIEYCAERVSQAISESADRALGVLERGYTEREIKTWSQQRSEAEAWSADKSASVRFLEGRASRRGIELSDMVGRVLKKVEYASDVGGLVLGDSDAAADKIAALLSLDADPDAELPADWFDQLQEIAANWRNDWPPELQSAIEN